MGAEDVTQRLLRTSTVRKTVALIPSAISYSPFSLGRVKLYSLPGPNILKDTGQQRDLLQQDSSEAGLLSPLHSGDITFHSLLVRLPSLTCWEALLLNCSKRSTSTLNWLLLEGLRKTPCHTLSKSLDHT